MPVVERPEGSPVRHRPPPPAAPGRPGSQVCSHSSPYCRPSRRHRFRPRTRKGTARGWSRPSCYRQPSVGLGSELRRQAGQAGPGEAGAFLGGQGVDDDRSASPGDLERRQRIVGASGGRLPCPGPLVRLVLRDLCCGQGDGVAIGVGVSLRRTGREPRFGATATTAWPSRPLSPLRRRRPGCRRERAGPTFMAASVPAGPVLAATSVRVTVVVSVPLERLDTSNMAE